MKKQLTFLVLLALLGAFMFSLEGCGDDSNPCKGKEPITAQFDVGVDFLGLDTVIVGDTILAGSSIVFRSKSKEKYQSYEWKIGDDTRKFNTNEVKLYFSEDLFPLPQSIEVKLKVQDSFFEKCYPLSKGQDSVTRKIVIVPEQSTLVFGDYEGYLEENPSSRFVVSIRYCDPVKKRSLCSNNIDLGCDNKLYTSEPYPYVDISYTYRVLHIGDSRSSNFINSATGYPGINCNDPLGWLYFGKSKNQVFIDYSTAVYPDSKKRTKHRFVGKRI
jgi:hypothetical protein